MSRTVGDNAEIVLEGVGLKEATIRACFNDNNNKQEKAVQAGLIKWAEGQGKQPPTWKVLVEAMKHAEIKPDTIEGLKKELKGMLSVLLSSVCAVASGACLLCMASYKSTFDMECV